MVPFVALQVVSHLDCFAAPGLKHSTSTWPCISPRNPNPQEVNYEILIEGQHPG
jgi:hypothetical protein